MMIQEIKVFISDADLRPLIEEVAREAVDPLPGVVFESIEKVSPEDDGFYVTVAVQ